MTAYYSDTECDNVNTFWEKVLRIIYSKSYTSIWHSMLVSRCFYFYDPVHIILWLKTPQHTIDNYRNCDLQHALFAPWNNEHARWNTCQVIRENTNFAWKPQINVTFLTVSTWGDRPSRKTWNCLCGTYKKRKQHRKTGCNVTEK